MRRALMLVFALTLAAQAFAQSGAVIPQGGAGHAASASCVLLKRMGPADQVTSRLYSFGIRGKQFQYIEGQLPDGFPFHGRMTDHDVRNLQGRGAEVIVLKQDYTDGELQQARQDCLEKTGKSPNQAVAAVKSGVAANEVTSADFAMPSLKVSSDPSGADIEIDGNFVGNTPSTLNVASGQHNISVKKSGFKPWERKMLVSGGQVNVNATLEAQAQ